MAFLAAKRTVLPVKKHTLTNMRLHVTFSRLCEFTGAVAKWAVTIGNFDGTLAIADRAFLDISLRHPL